MRVWALASCGGLLALAACSADQTNTTNPNSPPSDADSLAQGQKSPTTVTPSPLARPEIPSPQTSSARPRLNPAAISARADRTAPQPQSDQLRARLQRLRAQQGARLASNTSVAAAPIPTVVASPILQPGAPILLQADSTPGASRDSRLAIVPTPNRAEQSPLLANPTPLPSPQPTVIKADVESSGTTVDLQTVVAASIASRYPIAPPRHQGYSLRSASPQVLVPPSTSQPIAASARLHGSKAPALTTQPNADTAEQVSGTTATLVPDLAQDSAALLASASSAAISREHAASQSRAGSLVTLTHPGDFPDVSPAGGAHQQESTASLRSAERLPLQASLAPRRESRTTVGQGSGAIALPESLPLNSAAPRLGLQRPQLSPAQPNISQPTAAQPTVAQVITDRATTEPTVEPLAVSSGGHLSQTRLDRFRLEPSASQSPKGLSLADCPSKSAPLSLDDRLVNGAIAAQPSFSGRNQNMTLVKEAPTALCWGNVTTQGVALETDSAAAPAPHSLDFSAAEAAELDLETLTPAPLAD